jgi:adenylyltransferase/sulfurtransferase
MDDNQLLRYSRQIMLPGLDIEGQQRLLQSRALIVGLGGLGSPAALYLASAGVGRLLLADFDRVDLTNLQRQILHGTANVGELKTESAAARLRAINPDVELIPVEAALDDDNLADLVSQVDVVVEGSDNFLTRFAVNRACVANRVPLVSGAVIRMEGQLAVFRPDLDEEPCYRCVFPEAGEAEETCSETGVLGPLPGVIGSLQAVETLKLLTGLGTPLNSRLMTLNAMNMEWRTLRLRRDPECPVCGLEGLKD